MTADSSPGSAPEALGPLLAAIRKDSHLSQKAIARQANCDQSNVSYVEHDKRPLTRELFSAYFALVREDPTMQRRLLLAASTAGAIGAVFGPESEGALEESWAAANKIDTAWWDDRVTELAADFVAAPATEMRPRLHTELRSLAKMYLPAPLRSTAAKLACMYARIQTDTPASAYWMTEALAAAKTSDDVPTLGWVLGRAALEFSHGPRYGEVFAYVRDAEAIAEAEASQLAQVGAFNALIGAAHAAVTARDTDRAVHYWEAAQFAFDRVDTDAEGDFGCTVERMAINASHLLSRMGDAAADDWTAVAFGSGDDDRHHTYSGIHQALRAHAVGDPDSGVMAQAVLNAIPAQDQWASLKRMAVAAGAPETAPLRAKLA